MTKGPRIFCVVIRAMRFKNTLRHPRDLASRCSNVVDLRPRLRRLNRKRAIRPRKNSYTAASRSDALFLTGSRFPNNSRRSRLILGPLNICTRYIKLLGENFNVKLFKRDIFLFF